MKWILIFFIALVQLSCTNQKNEWIKFDQDVIHSQEQDFAFKLKYLGKDTMRIVSIAKTNSIIYRLKTTSWSTSIIDYAFFLPPSPFYMDSSTNAGLTWSGSVTLNISLDFLGDINGFYVSDNGLNKYIISGTHLLVSYNNLPFKELSTPYISECFYDSKNDVIYVTTYRNTLPYTKASNTDKITDFTIGKDTFSLLQKSISDSCFYLKVTDFKNRHNTIDSRLVISMFTRLPLLRKKVAGYLFDGQIFYKQNLLSIVCDDRKKPEYHQRFYINIIDQSQGTISTQSFSNDSIKEYLISKSSSELCLIGMDTQQKISYAFIPEIETSRSSFFARLKNYRIQELNDKINVTIRLEKGNTEYNYYNFKLYGGSMFDYSEHRKLLCNSLRPNKDSTIWEASFSVDSINLHSAEKYRMEIVLNDHFKETRYDIDKFFHPVSIYDRFPKTIILIILTSFVICILLLFYFISPYVIYILYTKLRWLDKLEKLLGKYGVLIRIVNQLTVVPLLTSSSRVSFSWLQKNKNKIIDYYQKHEQTVKQHSSYIPLPIKIYSSGIEIENPSPELISPHFKKKRVCIEIIGEGGSGKTTLAIQLGLWTLNTNNSNYFNNRICLPILIEEDSLEIFHVIKRKIRTIINHDISDDFLNSLLKNKCLLIIIDALSERSEGMQSHVKRIYSSLDINCMIITSRKIIGVEGGDGEYFYPQSMNAEKVLKCIKNKLEESPIKFPLSEVEQVEILKRILMLFDITSTEVPIIPILVSLLIDKIIEVASKEDDFHKVLSQIPSSIPDVYSDYLLRVNPKNGSNLFPDEEIMKYSEIIAELSVGVDYVPKDISYNSIISNLETDKQFNKSIIDRFIENGILVKRRYANDYFVRFSLDPLAEYLAAIKKAKECSSDKTKWQNLYNAIDEKKAENFYLILFIVQKSFAAQYGWWEIGEIF